MEQRDLLKDQIEQMGKVLAAILSEFLGLKSKGKVQQGLEISNKRLQSELEIDIEQLKVDDEQAIRAYIKDRQLTEVHLELLSEYLVEIGKIKSTATETISYLKQAIRLLEMADGISKTLSFERIEKRQVIETQLESVNRGS